MESKRNLWILGLSQALGVSGLSAVTLIGGLLGARLAPDESLATLPVTTAVIGTALSSIPASLWMRRAGRRAGFLTGTGIALAGTLLAAYAVGAGSFALLCLATFAMGINSAFISQYRFAAAESVRSQEVGRAISLVLIGGIAAGFLGPEVARLAKDWLGPAEFSGSFVVLGLLYAAVLGLLLFFEDTPPAASEAQGPERPLSQVAGQPLFLAAVLSGTVAYGVMTFTMTATPVYMNHMQGFDLASTAVVIQSHIMAMFLPSLFSGWLVERLGVTRVMLLGVACLTACVALAMVSVHLLEFWGALVLLGMGWNFLYVGATVLLTRTYRPGERFKAQATNDFTILGVQAITSLSAGSLLFATSWQVLNTLNLPFLALTAGVLLALRRQAAVGVQVEGG